MENCQCVIFLGMYGQWGPINVSAPVHSELGKLLARIQQTPAPICEPILPIIIIKKRKTKGKLLYVTIY